MDWGMFGQARIDLIADERNEDPGASSKRLVTERTCRQRVPGTKNWSRGLQRETPSESPRMPPPRGGQMERKSLTWTRTTRIAAS